MTRPIIPFVSTAGSHQTDEWIHALQKALPGETVVPLKKLSDAERRAATVAIVANPDPADLREMPQLVWVQSVWAGVDRMMADLGGSDLKVVRLIDPQMAATMAESVLTWTLYLHRDIPAYAAQQRQRLWRELDYVAPQDRTIGLLGLGALGAASAHRLVVSGFRVCGWSRSEKHLPNVECYSGDDGLGNVLKAADILVCLLPLTPATRGLLNRERLSLLRRGSSLINFARGAIVKDDDLREALESGQIDHAVLDVFETEPLPADRWQWTHPRVTVLPHCTAPTDKVSASRIVAQNITRYRQTGEIPASIDALRGY